MIKLKSGEPEDIWGSILNIYYTDCTQAIVWVLYALFGLPY